MRRKAENKAGCRHHAKPHDTSARLKVRDEQACERKSETGLGSDGGHTI